MGPHLTHLSVLTTTVEATADVAAQQLVGVDGAPAGEGAPIIGVARTAAKAGGEVAVDVLGVFDLVAPAPIAKGAAVASNADGAVVASSAGAFGHALTAAANPGDIVSVLIK